MDELRIDEELLNQCILEATVGESQHRGIKSILEMIAMAGYRWRTPVKVVLFNSDNEAELDDDYADYLDEKACANTISWNEYNSEVER
ncbi:MAG: hypothetical protein HOC79_02655 [Euryarchaeota archaeon]|jgi:hypothetical protein|nr:hypothetical protein [Euryarchaeota archaeon]